MLENSRPRAAREGTCVDGRAFRRDGLDTVGCLGCDGRSYRHLTRCQQKRRELGLSASSSSRDALGDTVMSDAPTPMEEAPLPLPPAEPPPELQVSTDTDGARRSTSVWSRGTSGDKPD